MVVAETLEEAFSKFQECQFKDFYYAPNAPESKPPPYLSERGLVPYKEENGLYFFRVRDYMYGLPVSELILPGTWDMHAVIFDVPLEKSQEIFKHRFGHVFAPSEKSAKGEVPALEALIGNSSQSSLYCNEVEGGE